VHITTQRYRQQQAAQKPTDQQQQRQQQQQERRQQRVPPRNPYSDSEASSEEDQELSAADLKALWGKGKAQSLKEHLMSKLITQTLTGYRKYKGDEPFQAWWTGWYTYVKQLQVPKNQWALLLRNSMGDEVNKYTEKIRLGCRCQILGGFQGCNDGQQICIHPQVSRCNGQAVSDTPVDKDSESVGGRDGATAPPAGGRARSKR
jgi:hypothetical protein